jgi:hypothetical protein
MAETNEDYNRELIEKIDEIKEELIENCYEYFKLKERHIELLERIQNLDYSKRLENPCTKCFVRPSCDIKQYKEASFAVRNSLSRCKPKLKYLLLKGIKKDVKLKSFVYKNLHIFDRVLSPNYKLYTTIFIYPKYWEV